MTARAFSRRIAAAFILAAAALLPPCGDQPARAAQEPEGGAAAPATQQITVKHALGETVIVGRPKRVVALDMNEVDALDRLGVAIAGMPKDYVPHFLSRYRTDADVKDVGSIVKPNLEQVYALKPDLILISALHAQHYQELSKIAPTIHFDADYKSSGQNYIAVIEDHLLTLGRIFGKDDVARRTVAELDDRVAEARRVIGDRPERALIVLHNKGAFSSFGPQSRYGFVFDALGVKPASPAGVIGLHGQPVSSEFIQTVNPDVIYVIDRTAVMERRTPLSAESMSNPLLRETSASKTNKMIFVDGDAWYVTAASVTSLKIILDDLLKGYR